MSTSTGPHPGPTAVIAPAAAPVPADAEVYTLRIWRQGTQFRAVLRAVGEEQLHLFTEPQRVAEFLAQSPAGAAPSPEGAR